MQSILDFFQKILEVEKNMRDQRKDLVQGIAEERIRILFRLAEEFCEKEPSRSKQYIQLALRIASRNKAKIPKELKLHYCKKCNCFLNEKNSKAEKQENLAKVKCKQCGFERKLKID